MAREDLGEVIGEFSMLCLEPLFDVRYTSVCPSPFGCVAPVRLPALKSFFCYLVVRLSYGFSLFVTIMRGVLLLW